MRKLEESLGILPMVDEHTPLAISVEESTTPEDPDFDYARQNIYEIIEMGKIAINGALRVANANEKSRDYEVIGGLLEKMSKVNKELLDLSKQKTDIKTAKKQGGGTGTGPQIGTQNNAIIVSSSADINKFIENQIKPVDDNI